MSEHRKLDLKVFSGDPLLNTETNQKAIATQKEMHISGVPEKIVVHALPLDPTEVRYIYTGKGECTLPNGSGGQPVDGSESIVTVNMAVGMKKPIGEVVASRYDDQDPNVNVQWRSHQYPKKPSFAKEVDREEIEQLDERTFVRRHYGHVSEIGAFDGDLIAIELLEEIEGFHLQSPYPGRKIWRITGYNRRKDGLWTSSFSNLTGATLLNGVQELRALSLGEIHRIGGSAAQEVLTPPSVEAEVVEQLLALPLPSKNEFQRAEVIGEEHAEIVASMREQMERLMSISLQEVQNDYLVQDAIEMLVDGILKYPDRVRILGNAVSVIDPSLRFQLAQALTRDGALHFTKWYQRNFSKGVDPKSPVSQRIIATSLLHFVQFWNSQTNGKFDSPDFQALASDVTNMLSKESGVRYPLSARVYEGIRSSAVEVFVEDYILEQRSRRLSSGK